MLDINVTIIGDKIIIDGLNQFMAEMPKVVQGGLKKVVRGVHRSAMDFLNGAGGINNYETRASKSGKQYQKKTGSKVEMYEGFTRASGEAQMFKRFTDSGGYPVPVRTGNLKRLLDFLDPGQSKGEFIAGPMEAIVYDSAEYASVIHEGTGSSAKFGKRPFVDDALAAFNQGDGIASAIEEEIQSEIQKRGLA
jgi:hypothetical protein